MRRATILTLTFAHLGLTAGLAQEPAAPDSLEARVWLDRGDEPVVQRGDDVRVYYRTNVDAYAAIFRIDTDGRISLLFPQHPDADPLVRGGRDYRLLFPESARWRVEEDPGAGYFFMVASPEPLDLSALPYDDVDGWDLASIGGTVYEDPYVAIDDYVAVIVPDWELVPYALDFLTYNVGDTHSYPRFLCYDCHQARSYAAWNPYSYQCPSYQVVVYDDPYFYPRFRYFGTRVVFARPLVPRPRYGVTVRVAGSGWNPVVRTRAAPPRRVVQYKETPSAPSYQPRNPVTRSPAAAPARRGAVNRAAPSSPRRPVSTRNGAAVAPGSRGNGAVRAGSAQPRRGTAVPSPATRAPEARPTLQRRPPNPSARLPERGSARARPGTTSRGTSVRPGTTRGTTRRAPSRPGTVRAPVSRAPSGRPNATRAPGRRPATAAPPRATARPPVRAAPRAAPGRAPARGGVTRPPPRRPNGAASRPRPSTGSRPAPGRATARPPAGRPPTRTGPTPRRRPGGRGG